MIPAPHLTRVEDGSFDLQRPVVIVPATEDAELLELGRLLAQDLVRLGLEAQTAVRPGTRVRPGQGVVELGFDPEVRGEEAYALSVGQERVVARASTRAGLFYATRSIVVAAGSLGRLAAGTTADAPRYGWRGAHLDVARHFFSVEEVKRFIDLLALHKMNVFHWHLTEDQGWRIQIDAYPELTQVAAWRNDGTGRYGGYYTKDEVRSVVAYAAERSVEVVPEIEMPGHAVAALAAYPELSCEGGPFDVETEWGIFDDVYCAGNDATFTFLKGVLDEVIELFPSRFLHVGGDECPKKRWRACPKCQARIEAHHLKNEAELQSWFIRDIGEHLASRDKRLVGWDEILEGGLAPGAMVMSWRGVEGGIRAAEMGHDVIMSPTSHCYFDYKQSCDEEEPGAWFAPALELEQVYAYEPTPARLSPSQAAHVLGVQANVWTERMPNFKQVEYMTFPRLCALAEVAWSGDKRDFSDFERRLSVHLRLLDRLGVGYRGSSQAAVVPPTSEEKRQYLEAMADRRRGQTAAAY